VTFVTIIASNRNQFLEDVPSYPWWVIYIDDILISKPIQQSNPLFPCIIIEQPQKII